MADSIEAPLTSAAKCACCNEQFKTSYLLEAHISASHLKYLPFECFYCNFVRLPTLHFFFEHMERQHEGQEVKSIYTPDKEMVRQLAKYMAESGGSSLQEHGRTSPSGISDSTCTSSRLSLTDIIQNVTVKLEALSPSSLSGRHSENLEKIAIEAETKSGVSEHMSYAVKMSAAFALEAVSPITSFKRLAEDCGEIFESESRRPTETRRLHAVRKLSSLKHVMCCSECDKVITTRQLLSHTLSSHFGVKTLECGYCDYSNPRDKSNMLKHIQRNHNKKTPKFIDRSHIYIEEINEVFKRCFPGKNLPDLIALGAHEDSMKLQPRVIKIRQRSTPVGENSAKKETMRNKRKVYCRSESSDSSASNSRDANSHWRSTRRFSPCEECGKKVCVSNNRLSHVLSYHFTKMQVWCGYCDYANIGQMGALKHHLKVKHPGKSLKNYTDERHKNREEVQALVWKCFPGTVELSDSRFDGMPLDRTVIWRNKRKMRRSTPLVKTELVAVENCVSALPAESGEGLVAEKATGETAEFLPENEVSLNAVAKKGYCDTDLVDDEINGGFAELDPQMLAKALDAVKSSDELNSTVCLNGILKATESPIESAVDNDIRDSKTIEGDDLGEKSLLERLALPELEKTIEYHGGNKQCNSKKVDQLANSGSESNFLEKSRSRSSITENTNEEKVVVEGLSGLGCSNVETETHLPTQVTSDTVGCEHVHTAGANDNAVESETINLLAVNANNGSTNELTNHVENEQNLAEGSSITVQASRVMNEEIMLSVVKEAAESVSEQNVVVQESRNSTESVCSMVVTKRVSNKASYSIGFEDISDSSDEEMSTDDDDKLSDNF